MRWVIECLMPWRRLARIVRELDAEERIGAARMEAEWRQAESARLLRQFYEPSRFVR